MVSATMPAEAAAIPPELLLRRDRTIRYERGGAVYATDGRVGTLKQIVVDEAAGEVVDLIVAVETANRVVTLPADFVARTAGSAVFLIVNRAQFTERAAGATYEKRHFARVNLKTLLVNAGQASRRNPRRAVAQAGDDFVETAE